MKRLMVGLMLVLALVGCTESEKSEMGEYVLGKAEERVEQDFSGYEIVGYTMSKYELYDIGKVGENYQTYRITFLSSDGNTFSYNVYIQFNKMTITEMQIVYDN